MDSSSPKTPKVLQGIAASPGLAQGNAFVFLQKELEVPMYGVNPSEVEIEIQRLEQAKAKTREEILEIQKKVHEKLGEAEAKIFEAHLLVLEDQALFNETIEELKKTAYNVDYCFKLVSRRYIKAFSQIDDEYIRERAADVRDVTKRLLNKLLGRNEVGLMHFNDSRVVVSDDFSPSDAAEVEKDNVLGVVTNKGSRTSHAVIMARSLGLPAVVGLHNITEHVQTDDVIIVDGYDGVVIINPDPETLERYQQIRHQKQRLAKEFESALPLPSQTQDSQAVPLLINLEGGQDFEKLQTTGADGVGLFRTEGLFLRSEHTPGEEEQYEVYREIAQRMGDLPVTIRTLDLGGDKRASTNFLAQEEVNPFMGFRAIRLCLEHKELFKEQLRAILRASAHGNVNLMYPMITSAEELIQANSILEEAKAELKAKGIAFNEAIEVGSMIETPSAAMSIDLIAPHCKFISIGTNDLIQYTLAVDRVNDRIAHLYQPNHPAVVRMLEKIIQGAKEVGLKVSVCGEIAADPLYAALLMGLGVDSLSVTPAALAEIKYLIRSVKATDVQALAQHVLKQGDPHAILHILRDFYLKSIGNIATSQE